MEIEPAVIHVLHCTSNMNWKATIVIQEMKDKIENVKKKKSK